MVVNGEESSANEAVAAPKRRRTAKCGIYGENYYPKTHQKRINQAAATAGPAYGTPAPTASIKTRPEGHRFACRR